MRQGSYLNAAKVAQGFGLLDSRSKQTLGEIVHLRRPTMYE